MKQLFFILFFFVSFNVFSQAENSKISDIKTLIIVSGAENNLKVAVESMLASMKKNPVYSNIPEDFWDNFQKEITYKELVDLYVPIYDKHYTQDEIRYLIKFYDSPIGKKMIEKMPLILVESMNAGREWGMKLGMKVAEKMKKE